LISPSVDVIGGLPACRRFLLFATTIKSRGDETMIGALTSLDEFFARKDLRDPWEGRRIENLFKDLASILQASSQYR
jgi:hypothetical protein